jgi:hypothetical protein
MRDIKAVRLRIAAQRLADAMRICLEQMKKRAMREAWAFRQRAANLEQEAVEDAALSVRERDEVEEGAKSDSSSTTIEEDKDDAYPVILMLRQTFIGAGTLVVSTSAPATAAATGRSSITSAPLS